MFRRLEITKRILSQVEDISPRAPSPLPGPGDNNVYIGAAMLGIAGENNACYIKSIHEQMSALGIPVLVNGASKLGTAPSSKRYKQDVKSMDAASELIFALRPVTFRVQKGR